MTQKRRTCRRASEPIFPIKTYIFGQKPIFLYFTYIFQFFSYKPIFLREARIIYFLHAPHYGACKKLMKIGSKKIFFLFTCALLFSPFLKPPTKLLSKNYLRFCRKLCLNLFFFMILLGYGTICVPCTRV